VAAWSRAPRHKECRGPGHGGRRWREWWASRAPRPHTRSGARPTAAGRAPERRA
jgi:hypothetical protein